MFRVRLSTWLIILAIHLVPSLVLGFGIWLGFERLNYAAPDQTRKAVVVEIIETWTVGEGTNSTRDEERRTERSTETAWREGIRYGRSFWPAVSFVTRDGREMVVTASQPVNSYIDIGDRIDIRFDRRDPEQVLVYAGFWSLWAAPVIVASIGFIFNLLCVIASEPLIRRDRRAWLKNRKSSDHRQPTVRRSRSR